MAEMTARQVASSSMMARQSTDATVEHTLYDAMDIEFDQNQYTYEYKSFRGEIQPREISTVQMRGR